MDPGPAHSHALLVRLDAALAGGDALRHDGLVAATELNRLLVAHRLTWDDVAGAGTRLAKLLGRLGSEYPAEQEAGYDHAVRVILGRHSRWSLLIRLPPWLPEPRHAPTPPPPQSPPIFAAPPPEMAPRPAHTIDLPDLAMADGLVDELVTEPPLSPLAYPPVTSPDGDWLTTIHRLRERGAWRSEREHALLDALELELAAGGTLSDAAARRLRDIWWDAEMNDPMPEEP